MASSLAWLQDAVCPVESQRHARQPLLWLLGLLTYARRVFATVMVRVLAAGRVLFWDLIDAHVVSTLQAHSSVVCGLAAHPNDKMMLTAAVDGTVKVWQ